MLRIKNELREKLCKDLDNRVARAVTMAMAEHNKNFKMSSKAHEIKNV